MNLLVGFLIGVIAMGLIIGICAAIGTVVYSHITDIIPFYAGVAAGLMLVLLVVSFIA